MKTFTQSEVEALLRRQVEACAKSLLEHMRKLSEEDKRDLRSLALAPFVYLPDAVLATPLVMGDAAPVACDECEGTGDVFDDAVTVPCVACGGTGGVSAPAPVEPRVVELVRAARHHASVHQKKCDCTLCASLAKFPEVK